MSRPSTERVRALLEQDRAWCAYALADLDPEHAPFSRWWMGKDAVVLVYSGLTPAVLFAHGAPGAALQLLRQVPPGEHQYTLTPTQRALVGDRLRSARESRMWRMTVRKQDFRPEGDPRTFRVQPGDVGEVDDLFARHWERPDSFHPRQLELGPFFGIRDASGLAALAGVHVISRAASVAAVGNVFTRPDARGRGLAGAVSSAVVTALLEAEIRTIVLNVAMENGPALRLYRRLGFMPFCGYFEGVGVLLDSAVADGPDFAGRGAG